MWTARRAFSGRRIDPVALPPWLTEADIDVFAAEYARTGFRGGLNWYRNIDRNWALTAPWHGANITQPALFIAGTRDAVITGSLGTARARRNGKRGTEPRAQDPARGRRPLDPAGAPGRGERRTDRIRAGSRDDIMLRDAREPSRNRDRPLGFRRFAIERPSRRTPCPSPPRPKGAPALRGSRQRHAAPVRARVRRRPSRLGTADALLRAALSLHHLFGSRLYALRRAAEPDSYGYESSATT